MHLLMSAYPDIEVQPWKVSGGPAWLNNDTWDLWAKLPANMLSVAKSSSHARSTSYVALVRRLRPNVKQLP
jgi:hypothetical protein